MAVLVPLNSERALPLYAEAGVEEIYVGFHDDAWEAAFGPNAELNRMSGFGLEANPFSFEQMCEQIGRAGDLGMRAFVCFNSAAYGLDQLSFMAREYLPGIAEAGAAGIIVSGQGLIGRAREAGLQVVMSTLAGVFNARLAAYYRDCGATRLILPRDLGLHEIRGIVEAVPDMQYEVFLMRNGCVFSDSHCMGRHCAGRPSLCLSLRSGDMRIRPVDPLENQFGMLDGDAGPSRQVDDFLARAYENERVWAQLYHRRTCGLCALWRFERMGIAAYKVVGRGDDLDDLCADAGLVARNAVLARACVTEAEYLQRMERPRQPETLCGYAGLSCYYPDERYWESWQVG